MSRRIFALLLLATAALLALASCIGSHGPVRAPATSKPAPRPALVAYRNDEYVGDAVCSDCHYTISKPYSATSHATTLRRLPAPDATAVAPPVGYIGRTDFCIRSAGAAGGFNIAYVGGNGLSTASDASQSAPLDLAVGSGKTGVTYLSTVDRDHLLIARYSYFPHERKQKWFPTPRRTPLAPDATGEILPTNGAQRCIECHTTSLPSDTLLPANGPVGIGCEACHGAGGGHVNAMRRGQFHELHTRRLAVASAAEIIQLCGRCHETESNIETTATHGQFPTATYHGHGHALARSQCFLKSQGKLSCLSCHDPHTDVNQDEARYVAACLSCHGPSRAAHVSCPVNPKGHCVSCHMPKHSEIPGSEIPALLTSHRIAIYRK